MRKPARTLVAAAVLAVTLATQSAAAAESPRPATCSLNDQNSICVIRLTVAQLQLLGQILEVAPVAHATWSPLWRDINAQVEQQQPKPETKPEK